MKKDDIGKTADSLARIAKEGPQVNEAFARAHADEEHGEVEPGFGSREVEEDSVDLVHPPPAMGLGTEDAYERSAQDGRRADKYNQATKEAFLQRKAEEQDLPSPDKGRDSGRE